MIIDFHSHVLPGIDDGSDDVATSLAMLEASRAQGVDVVIATPHFYAEKEKMDSYLEKRAHAVSILEKAIHSKGESSETYPELLVGAEVAFFHGISRTDQIRPLAVQADDGTADAPLLLVEMPFETWNAHVLSEIHDLVYKKGYQVMIAHLERYLKIYGNGPWIQELLGLPVIVQVNANSLSKKSLLDGSRQKKLIRLFADGQAKLLGSDMHGMDHRPPNLAVGRDVLQQKLGDGFLRDMDDYGSRVLAKAGVYPGVHAGRTYLPETDGGLSHTGQPVDEELREVAATMEGDTRTGETHTADRQNRDCRRG